MSGATRKLRISGSTDTATNGYLALEFVIPFFQLLLSLHLPPQKRPRASNDNILILLSGKCSASCAEITLDLSYNLDNSLIIGENTNGSMISNSGHIELPNSKCSVDMTFSTVYLTPDGSDYFEELRGFFPDIWVPAKEAETLAAKLMENLK